MSRRAILATAALCAAVFFSAVAAAPPAADPLGLFLIIERGDGERVTLLDGERFEPVDRFALRGPLADGPQFTPDGRYAFLATRNGWIAKYDLLELKAVAEVRAGNMTRGLALASDGKLLAVANAEPETLAILDSELRTVKILAATDAAKRGRSPVTMVRNSATRRSFVAALPALKELWEVSYDPKAPEIAEGLVHDYKLREGSFAPGYLNPRRTPLEQPIAEFRLVPDGRQLIGAAAGSGALHVVHLDVRRRIAGMEIGGLGQPSAAVFWYQGGRLLLAIPRSHPDAIAVIDATEWKALAAAAVQPPGDIGVSLMGGELDRAGRRALVSAAGRVAVHDLSTGREVKRLSLQEVVGKYNVFNQIRRHLD